MLEVEWKSNDFARLVEIRTRETEQALLSSQKAQKASNWQWYLKKSIKLYLREKKKEKNKTFSKE